MAEAALDSAVNAIAVIDEEGLVQRINPAAERLFGYDGEEMLGQNISMLMPEPYRSAHDAYLRNYLRTGNKRIIGIGREVFGQRKDGEPLRRRAYGSGPSSTRCSIAAPTR